MAYPRDSLRWTSPFGCWVGEFGPARIVEALARDPNLSITRNAPYDWLRGHQPRPKLASALVRLSGGELTLELIYQHGADLERARFTPKR